MEWSAAQARLREPPFDTLHAALGRLPAERWPDHADLTAAARGITVSSGAPLAFVPPRAASESGRRVYELHIARTGAVETRPRNWHDLFNALAWITFPRTKARINEQHAAILEEGGEREAAKRGPARDALTLFDEGGIAVASSSRELLRLIYEFRWKELFWTRREELARHVTFLGFGHAMYEQSLEPFLGMVGKTVFLSVQEGFTALALDERIARIDAMLARHFADPSRFASPRMMAPMPLLGIPGWHPGTAREDFYDDPVHFRGPRPKTFRPLPPGLT
ncbi:MAG TPA: DUF3025 domain-containing protein [Usitatibacter sp.]|jgi:hypothetical protein|nr:DUF3025 domain-containing protein [Usitatibacter sp.]